MFFTGSYKYNFTKEDTTEKQKLFDESGLTKSASVNGIRDTNEDKKAQFENPSPYDHDMDDESLYNKRHDMADPIEDARAQLLDMDIDSGVREFLLRALNSYVPKNIKASTFNAKELRAEGEKYLKERGEELKSAKLDPKDKKELKDYNKELYPDDYAEDMVADYDKKDKKKDTKNKKTAGKEMEGDDPCWDDYEMVGKKKKDGKEVPNCVKKKAFNLRSLTSTKKKNPYYKG